MKNMTKTPALASISCFRRAIVTIIAIVFAANVMAFQNDTIVVARDGTGDFRNVAEAIEKCRALMDFKRVIYIKKGIYKEKLEIPSTLTNVVLIGESRDSTIITYDDHANINNMGTFRSYTLKVSGQQITLIDLTIENNAAQLGQAVALFADGDGQYYYNCRFLGNQDTVYTGPGKATQHFVDCIIEGTTDFIFGPATAYFEHCTIISKKNSYITAAATPQDVEVGYVFTNCSLQAAPGVTKCYLGRPWRPYAYTLFKDCFLGAHICPEGWDNWRNPENEKTARYFEANNYGPGADTSKRVKWAKH
jgi:pectinesterase